MSLRLEENEVSPGGRPVPWRRGETVFGSRSPAAAEDREPSRYSEQCRYDWAKMWVPLEGVQSPGAAVNDVGFGSPAAEEATVPVSLSSNVATTGRKCGFPWRAPSPLAPR